MEDEIGSIGKQVHVPAQGLAHAALDAIALVGFAKHFAGGQTHARPAWFRVSAAWVAGCGFTWSRREKPTH